MFARRRRKDARTRRRDVASLVLSALVHIAIGAFFAIRALAPSQGIASEAIGGESVAITEDRARAHAVPRETGSTASPTPAPPTVIPTTVRRPTTSLPQIVRANAPLRVVNKIVAPPVRRSTKAETTPRRAELATIVQRPASPPPRRVALATMSPAKAPPANGQITHVTSSGAASEPPAEHFLESPRGVATLAPTAAPTLAPTVGPTLAPTAVPTIAPTVLPTLAPTAAPTLAPTAVPTIAPTQAPKPEPTRAPTLAPTAAPTQFPTREPIDAPTQAPLPATARSAAPTAYPTATAAGSLAAVPANRSISAAASAAANAPGAGSEVRSSPAPAASTETSGGTSETHAAPTGPSIVANRPDASTVAPRNANNGGIDRLNSRLRAALQGAPVAYSEQHFTNTLDEAVDRMRAEYYAAVAPPAELLAKVIKVVRQHGVLLDHSSSIVYIIKRQRILGLEICSGWKVETAQPGAKPTGSYTFGSCGGEEFTPPAGLPTPPPRAP